MTNQFQFFAGAAVLAAASMLSGCGTGEPSENDLFDAMLAADQQQLLFGKPEKFRTEAKKLGCEKTGEKSYKCLIGQRNGEAGSVAFSFMKAEGKWVMVSAPGMVGG